MVVCWSPASWANMSRLMSSSRSRALQETNGMPLWAARAQLGWAEALAARGDAAGAREHATRALELSREHGYGTFESRAVALADEQSTAEA